MTTYSNLPHILSDSQTLCFVNLLHGGGTFQQGCEDGHLDVLLALWPHAEHRYLHHGWDVSAFTLHGSAGSFLIAITSACILLPESVGHMSTASHEICCDGVMVTWWYKEAGIPVWKVPRYHSWSSRTTTSAGVYSQQIQLQRSQNTLVPDARRDVSLWPTDTQRFIIAAPGQGL